jgi:hypothetical protein
MRLLRQNEWRQQVQRYDFLREFWGGTCGRDGWATSGIVHQDIQAPKSLANVINQPLRGNSMAKISGVKRGAITVTLDGP